MQIHRYVKTFSPWKTTIDTHTRHPADYLARLVDESLRLRMPTSGKKQHLHRILARTGMPRFVFSTRRWIGSRQDPELDELRRELARSGFGPEGDTSLLVIHKKKSRLIFGFGDAPEPCYVAKVPLDEVDAIDNEVQILKELDGTGIAPRFLGSAGGARVQEAIHGNHIDIDPITTETAGLVTWPQPLARLASTLESLGEITAQDGSPDRALELIEAGLQGAPARDADTLATAAESIRRSGRSVLQHGDLSPQNYLLDSRGSVGLVDWELADRHGMAGFDILNAALAVFELGVGKSQWSVSAAVGCFRKAWADSEFWHSARAAVEDCATAAGMGADGSQHIPVAFFARRLGRRLTRPDVSPDETRLAAEMLSVVCEY